MEGGIDYKSPENLHDQIEQTAEKRAEYTRDYLKGKGESLENFAKELQTLNIAINPDDNKSLALGVFELQKKLGFPEQDTAKGCDAKLGAYTYHAYKAFLVKQNTRTSIQAQAAGISPKPALEKPPVIQNIPRLQPREPEEETRLEKMSIEKVLIAGDSLAVGTSNAEGMQAAKKCVKGGTSAKTMNKNLIDPKTNRINPEYRGAKMITVISGINDLSNTTPVEEVKKRLTQTYEAAKREGMTVVACTIPDWDTASAVKIFQRNFEKHGYNHGVYPLSPEDLQARTEELNKYILSLNDPKNGIIVADLYTEMQDHKKYPRGDAIHPTPQGYAAMAKFIQSQANIG